MAESCEAPAVRPDHDLTRRPIAAATAVSNVRVPPARLPPTRVGSALGVALVISACEPSAPPEVPKPRATAAPLSLVPFLVDDPHGAVPLEADLRRSAVLVGYDGSGLRLLRGCTTDATYTFTGSAPEPVRKVFSGYLPAELPMTGRALADRLGPELERGALLTLDAVLSGTFTLTRVPQRAELRGECAGATHVVVSASVGAFRFGLDRRGVRDSIAGSVGAAAIARGPVLTLGESGEPAACEIASPEAKTPPKRCDGLVRLALDPLDPP